jgi:spermidine/putrescine transport system substrate-binding protein
MPDPFIEHAIERMLEEERFSRRRFVGRLGAAGVALSGASALLAACGGTEGTGDEERDVDVNHPQTAIDRLNFANWPLYIDKKVVKDFERRFDAQVRYVEEINDNNEFFGKVQETLKRDQSIERDLVVLTDWMSARWIRLGYTEPIDKDNVPNSRNLQDNLKSPKYDPERNHTLPWQSGMDGIGYNPRKTGREIRSVNDLFDPEFKGRVSLLSDAYDSAGLVLQGMGKNTEDATLDDVMEAIDKIEEENEKGQIRAFTGNEFTTDLANGNLWLAVAYSGDMVQLKADNPELEFVIPEEGGLLWTDNMMMPDGVEHPYAAETLMNYVYDPAVAAKIAAFVNYVTPVKGAQEEVEKIDPDLAQDPLIFPTDEERERLHPYVTLDADEERQMIERMAEVTGA